MSYKSKETVKIVELLGIGYSFTDMVNTVWETAGEYVIFYSLTELQKK